jgi:hypothetical protein
MTWRWEIWKNEKKRCAMKAAVLLGAVTLALAVCSAAQSIHWYLGGTDPSTRQTITSFNTTDAKSR